MFLFIFHSLIYQFIFKAFLFNHFNINTFFSKNYFPLLIRYFNFLILSFLFWIPQSHFWYLISKFNFFVLLYNLIINLLCLIIDLKILILIFQFCIHHCFPCFKTFGRILVLLKKFSLFHFKLFSLILWLFPLILYSKIPIKKFISEIIKLIIGSLNFSILFPQIYLLFWLFQFK